MFNQTKVRSLTQLLNSLETNPDPHFIDEMKQNPAKAIREVIDLTGKPDQKIQSFQQLKEVLEEEPEMLDLFKNDPQGFIQKMVKESPPPEYRIYRMLVGSLCALVIIIILGVMASWIIKNKREAPGLVTAMACTSLGILSGIFISVPRKGIPHKYTDTEK